MGDAGPGIGRKLAAVGGLFVFGALNTLTSKILFTTPTDVMDANGNPRPFQKPFFVTFMMFCAMTLVIFSYRILVANKQKNAVEEPLLEKPVSELTGFFYIAIPATFDLIATAMMLYGLTLMPASIYQMLRGSMIIFAAFAYKFLMGKTVHNYQWFGVLICVCGVSSVGASTILNTSSGHTGPQVKVSTSDTVFGIFLVVASQAVQAAQVVVEEVLMKNVKLHPLMIVGYEGTWGVIESLVVLFPILYFIHGKDNGHLEDTVETFEMIPNNVTLESLILLYLFSCSTFNVTSVMVTNYFNAVHRTILEATRTVGIWGFGLIVHCVDPTATYGEAWLPYSYLELIGFLLLLTGQGLYGDLYRLPCFKYPKVVDATAYSSPPRSP